MTYAESRYSPAEFKSCYDILPAHKQQVIFRTDHEGVWCGRYYQYQPPYESGVVGVFSAMTENGTVIGWNFRRNVTASEVHEWAELPK